MPSLHTAWAVALFIHSRSGPWWIRSLGSFWHVATLTATLGFGFHYGVDLLAGAVLCLTLDAALRGPERGWGWFRDRKSVVEGRSGSVRVDLGGRRNSKKKKNSR